MISGMSDELSKLSSHGLLQIEAANFRHLADTWLEIATMEVLSTQDSSKRSIVFRVPAILERQYCLPSFHPFLAAPLFIAVSREEFFDVLSTKNVERREFEEPTAGGVAIH